MVHPIEDSFSQRDPYLKRSSAFATTKGLTTNEKAAPPVIRDPLATPDADADPKRHMGPLIPLSMRSRTPEGSCTAAAGPGSSRGKTPLSAWESAEGTSDLRTVTTSQAPRPDMNSKQPSQGNIKKKRRSLGAGEWSHPAEYIDSDLPPQPAESPVLGPNRSGEYGNNEKAARVLGLAL